MKKKLPIIQTVLASLALVILIAVNVVLPQFFDLINAVVCGTYSAATDAEIALALEKGAELADDIQEEGTVLVANNGALPLKKTAGKVNVLGWSSTQWIYGGSGSGRCLSMKQDFLDALAAEGIETNGELTEFYRYFLDNRPFYSNSVGSLNSYYTEFSRLYEPALSSYPDGLLERAKEFSDTAIVVLSRVCGESNDCPRVQYRQNRKGGEIITDEARTYLEISPEEEALIKYAAESFETTVVVVNSTNAMELGFAETVPGLDACVIAGGTGEASADSLVRVLYGDVCPSGRTVDTYAYDFSTSAAYANCGVEGEGKYTNGEGKYPFGAHSANVGRANEKVDAVRYVDYVEGIYVGYRWYETADAEGYWDGAGGYGKIVQYPFGFGLSYTTFSWETAGEPVVNSEGAEISVRVTNTGSVSGKDVVQLYWTPPYDGGIEKSAVNLADFAKTKLLAPGESEVLKLKADAYSMASYDYSDANANGFKRYELESGTYALSVRRNAHEKGIAEDVPFIVAATVIFENDPVTGSAVENRFTGDKAEDCGVSIDGSNSGADITFLSRKDFAGTFQSERKPDRAMTDNVAEWNLYDAEKADARIRESDAPVTTGKSGKMIVYEPGSGINELGMKLGSDYDAPEWEDLLDLLTRDQLENLVYHYYLSPNLELPQIGKYKPYEADGPTQIGSFNAARTGTGFPCPTVIAQTWSKELASAFGRQVGLEAADLGFDGWYAPGINLHRTPFSGRNYEYYSEDPVRSGKLCERVVSGAHARGVYCCVKHLVANDQDGNRDSLYTWLTEQALRELYLKPFEIAVKGGLTGIMTSYNRLGAVWAGGSEALIRGVVRNEWGFKGAVLTDYADHPEYDSTDQCIRAGGDQVLFGYGGNVSFRFETESNTFMQALRSAAKNSVYIWLNALYKNRTGGLEPRHLRVDAGGWLLPVLIVLDVLAFAGLAVWGFFIVKRFPAGKKE